MFVASHLVVFTFIGPAHWTMHTVPTGYLVHPPAPSQSPLVPQVEAGWVGQRSRGSSPPAGTGWQVPGPEPVARLHE